MKTLNAVATLAVLALALPAAALAHEGAATVSCTGADFSFANFAAGSNTVNYKVTVDSNTVAEGTYVLNLAGGKEGHLVVPLAVHDTHTVKAFAWWGPAGVQNGETRPAGSPPLANTVVQCPAAPPPPPSAPAPVAPAPAAVAPPAPPAAIVVKGEQVRSAPTPRLAVQATCGSRHVRVTVSGQLMRQVRIAVSGRHARTIKVSPGARSVTTLVALRRHGPVVQAVTTRVTFRNGARPRNMVAPARRCGQVAVLPEFTG
jgi:hypothetical protein